MDEKTIARFWAKVDKRGPGECWEWTAYRLPDGYGQFAETRSRNILAHRVAWGIASGAPPGTLHVLHHCDNPSCCNAAHLFLGTNLDNIRDRVSKKRSSCHRGEGNPRSLVTAEDVLEIRVGLARGDSRRALAERFAVSLSCIDGIKSRKNWAHL